MPTYEYACTKCGHHLEIFQSFSDEPLKSCPQCGGDLRKVFGSIGIVLKGSGFYRTDSRKSPNGKSAPKERDREKKDTSSGAGGDAAASGSSTSTSDTTSASSTSRSASNGPSSSGSGSGSGSGSSGSGSASGSSVAAS